MKKVYIAHPLRGDGTTPVAENMAKVTEILRDLARDEPDILLVSPIHAFSYLSPDKSIDWTLGQCMALLSVCDELWVYGDYSTSEGCRMEIEKARSLNIPIVFNLPKKGQHRTG